MFETLGSFSIFYFSLSAIILLMLIFEKQLLALEDRYDEWRENKKKKNTRNKKRSSH